MQALVLHELKSSLVLEERPESQPGAGEVVVALRAAAFNRRDYWITQGLYPGIKLPVILGSDGAGVVARVGDAVDSTWKNQQVLINGGLNWGDDAAFQSEEFEILGTPKDGTFATEVVVPVSQIHKIPSHLNFQQAAAFSLAGMTAWRAVMTQGRLQPGETVLVTGIGGGVATCALQFAVAAGATVWVTSSSKEKIDRAVELGAAGGFDYTRDNWHQEYQKAARPPGLIIDSAGGKGYDALVRLASPGGRIVNYGSTAGKPESLDLFKVFWKQLHLIGCTMGSPRDFEAMLDFVSKHQLEPIIDEVLPLREANTGMQKLRDSSQFGKLVLSME